MQNTFTVKNKKYTFNLENNTITVENGSKIWTQETNFCGVGSQMEDIKAVKSGQPGKSKPKATLENSGPPERSPASPSADSLWHEGAGRI